jgi:hypothetical protein
MFTLRHILHQIKTHCPGLRTMADSVLNSHNADAIESKSDEPEFDFKEYYSKEKTMALRDVYIP